MGFFSFVIDKIVAPAVDKAFDAVEATGRGIDKAVNVVVIDGIAGTADKIIETAQENPGKAALIAGAAIVTGGAAAVAAPTIAAVVGATGVLGTTSTGTVISTLSGVALQNASLAALGGGAVAAGGGGMAAGTAAVAATGTTLGAAVSGVGVKVTS